MANKSKRISELPSLSVASLDTTYIVGISGSATYKISVNQLTSSLDSAFATDLVTTALSSSLDGKLSTSSFNSYTASFTASVASGIISGSSQLTSSFDQRYVLSGSITQTTWDNIANKPAGIVSQSTDLSSLNTFTASISTASLVNRLNVIESISGSWITESETGSFLTSLSGAISSSTQISALGFVTGSYTTINSFNTLTQSFNSISQSFTTISGSFGGINLGGLATTGSNIFIGNEIITGSLFVSGASEFGGDLVPKFPISSTLGTQLRPFKGIFVSSGSINIASDVIGDPNTTLSNVGGNILVSAGGMRLVGAASFIAVTGSFQYLSGSFTHIGAQFNEGDIVTTGSLQVSGSTVMIGNNTMQGNTLLSGSFGITGSTSFSELGNTSLLSFSSSLNSRINAATNEQSLGHLVTTSSFNSYTASISTASLVTSITNLNTFTASQSTASLVTRLNTIESVTSSYETKGRGIWSGSAQLPMGVVSGSIQVLGGSGVASGSYETTGRSIISSSAQITSLGFISSSAAIPVGTISSSAQITSFGFVSGSYLTNLSGAISSSLQVIGILSSLNIYTASVSTGSLLTTASFNQYTASISTASLVNSINALNIFTASQSTASLVSSINSLNTFTASQSTASLLTTASFNQYTASQSTASLLTTASFNQYTASITTGSLVTISSFNNYTASISTASLVSSITNLNNATSSYETQGRSIISSSAQITALRFVSSSVTASSIVSASSTTNVILFTKGDGSTTQVTVATGSATFVTSSFGTFHSSYTQSGSANTAYVMKLDGVDHQDGVILSGSGGMKVLQAGTYDIEFSAQLTNGSGDDLMDIWLRKNGTNVDSSNTRLVIKKDISMVAAWNWQDTANPNDVFEIMWSTTGGNMTINAFAESSSPTRPAIPSVIATIHRIDVGGGSNMISNTQFNPFTASINQFTSSINSWTSSFSSSLASSITSVSGTFSDLTLNGSKINANGVITKSYLFAQNNADQSNVGNGTAINFQQTNASNGSLITKGSNTQVTLTAGNTYKMEAIIRRFQSSNTWGSFRWYDVTNSAYVGVEAFGEMTTSPSPVASTGIATHYVTPSVNTTYELRQTTANTISVSSAYASIEIEQINSSFALNTLSGGINYTQVLGNRRAGINSVGTSIVSGSITTTGKPVQIMVTGDANPTTTAWCRLQIFRDGNAIGNIIQAENSSNLNVPYCLNVIDTPPAGTYTYSMRTVDNIAGTFDFGEASGPLLIAKELGSLTIITDTNNSFTGTNVFSGSTTLRGAVNVGTGSGNEGGEIDFAYAQGGSTTLTGSFVAVDIYQDKLRIFEGAGNNRGVSIDLSKAPNSVGGELMWKASGIVNAGTYVTLDNIKATVTTSSNRGLSVATVSGTVSGYISGQYQVITGGGGAGASSTSLSTTATTSMFAWNFTSEGDTATFILRDNTNNRVYRIIMIIGGAYNNNFISIERLY
jgi:hypothetical protein